MVEEEEKDTFYQLWTHFHLFHSTKNNKEYICYDVL